MKYTVSDVRRALHRYADNVQSDDDTVSQMLICFQEMTPEGQEELITIVAWVSNRFVRVFGPLQALELIGALMKEGYL